MMLDQQILFWINEVLRSNFADLFLGLVSERLLFSFPLFLILCVCIFIYLPKKQFWPIALGLLICVGIADQIGNFIKSHYFSPRPCDDLYMFAYQGSVLLTESCNSGKGMPSNHVLNFSVAATYLSLIIRNWPARLTFWLICFTVAVSRIYLAKHYPSQALAGLFLGIFIGLIMHNLLSRLNFFSPLCERSKNL